MEKKNNSGMLVGILIGIVITLLVVVGLFATGTIGFKTSTTSNSIQKDENKSETTSNEKIDSALENSLYKMLGIIEDSTWGDCLNYMLSSNDYKTNAKQIFGLYASNNSLNTNHYNDGACNEDCKKALSCGECSSIKKIDADKIIKMYSLNNLQLNELPGFKEEYAYTNGIPAGVCHYKVTHDTNSKYLDSNSIRIVDKQAATDYVFGEDNKVNSTKNQEVTYDLKKDNNGNYYLSQVTVK